MGQGSAFKQADVIEASLELLAERCPDPSPAVYRLLFERHPNMEVHFWRDTDGSIRGAMLSRCFEAILDFIGERRYAHIMIQNELITHEGYDIPRDSFVTFFGILRDTMRDLIGSEWTPAFEAAWKQLISDLAIYTGAVPEVNESNPYFKQLAAEFEAQGLATRAMAATQT